MNSIAQKLEDYKWQNRIVFLIDDAFDSTDLLAQKDVFKKAEKSMLERDIVFFLSDGLDIRNDQGEKVAITIEELRHIARITSDFKGVLLLGKDGGCKLKKDFRVEPKEIFDLVDKMPMRQFEMKNR